MSFRTLFGQTIFEQKYQRYPGESWDQRARQTADVVCRGLLDDDLVEAVYEAIRDFQFIPAGRYLANTGRPASYWNNCLALKLLEDTREEWASLLQRAVGALMTGAGIGCDYTIARPEGALLRRTGGLASGPLPLIEMIDEAGARVMQGGDRRSAMYATLNWRHADIDAFLTAKNWDDQTLFKGYSVGEIARVNRDFKA